MNWQAISFDWNQVRAFLATAETGSFSAAARALQSTQPTVGRQVAGLEGALGVVLFERLRRGPALTAAGRDLLDHMQAMGDAASRISLAASGQAQSVTGEVSITASDLLAAHYLPAVLVRLQEAAPGIVVRILSSNEIQNLSRREADIAVRHVRPDQPDLIARHLADYQAGLWGHARYFDRRGLPAAPRDLAGHRILGFTEPGQIVAALQEKGLPVTPEMIVASANSGVVVWEMVRAGLGLAILPDALAGSAPEMRRVLADHAGYSFPVWLTTHRELHTNRRIRIVFDALAEALRDPRALVSPAAPP